ncbi:CBASS cGAMP synthase [Denitromonas iodatirespirans]|uniref:Cyclic GMP-AMP synthase n=1 Tax=Denitromonas iodatirespirans TaxID=2795389 RepID=A0A944DG68_DENI1|nr:nucleotidyltransferase [Denitromonas iodatirespirans]MBT0963617.1 nucleotidyltransferase [Denitromonas iodatirespirans]
MGHAAQLFAGNRDQTLIKRVTPTAEQRQFLQEQWNALADHLKKHLPARHGYPVSTWLQGSYKYGTLIRPVHPGEEYDVDVGVYFHWTDEGDATPSPAQLREWVQDELVLYGRGNGDVKEVVTPPKERCSRVVYARQFHIDTPVYHLDPETDRRRLACLSDAWEDSDPKKLYKWFRNAASGDDREQLRRLVRYLKAWAAVSFDEAPESRPWSILLTVLATQAYQGLWGSLLGMDDDDALTAVIKKVHGRLFDKKAVPNPVDRTEDLNRISDAGWEGFLPRLQALLDVAERAEAAEDEASAALVWSEAFSFLMPLPETDQVEIVDERSGRAVMVLPDIEVQVHGGNPKTVLATYRNEVPSVAKDCELTFRITNPHVVPEYATVEWTVRNEGEDADQVSDLGHRRAGLRMLTANEHTAYVGRHFMDCIVRLNGRVYSVRRVPVNIRNLSYPQRNPPRPAYTKLRSILRRR